MLRIQSKNGEFIVLLDVAAFYIYTLFDTFWTSTDFE